MEEMRRMSEIRVAVMSDVHGNRWALEAVLADIERRGVRRTVNLGDCFYGPLDPAGTAEILIPLDLPTVRGNEDRILVDPPGHSDHADTLEYSRRDLDSEHIRWLKNLPVTRGVFEEFFLCHGSPKGDDRYLLWTWVDDGLSSRPLTEISSMLEDVDKPVVFCGHDHVPRTLELNSRRLVVDPGSVGLPAYSDVDPLPHSMETGTPHARYSIVSRCNKDWRVENIAVAYDWETAAARAERNGRPDWARWLRTGKAS
jgi:predicted phosphodiesterase